MSKEEQPEGISLGDFLSRGDALNMAVSVLAENFGNESAVNRIGDKDLLKRVSGESGEISGRTAIITEKVLGDYVRRLKSDIRELEQKIDERRDVNTEEAKAGIKTRRAEIRMIEGNCLNSLGNINNSILFPTRREEK